MMVAMMMSENQSWQSQVHVTAIWGTEDLAVKSQFNRLPGASLWRQKTRMIPCNIATFPGFELFHFEK
jgi:hypothetical protein